MDEINGSPMMERLVNALLTGSTPEGHKAAKPGFLLLGTQNPKSLGGGRQAQTEAQKKRMIQIVLDEYPMDEMRTILTQQYQIPPEKAGALVEMCAYLKQQFKTPLDIRNLLKVAQLSSNEKTPYARYLAKQGLLPAADANAQSMATDTGFRGGPPN